MSVGVKWSGSLEFTSISGSDGGSSTGIAGRREPRNPLRSFINNKVIPDIVSGSNQYFVTFESGNFGLPNNKMESISTAEITLAHDHGLEGIYGGELDAFRAGSGPGPFGLLLNTDQDFADRVSDEMDKMAESGELQNLKKKRDITHLSSWTKTEGNA